MFQRIRGERQVHRGSRAGKTIERVLNTCFAADRPISDARPAHAVLVRRLWAGQTSRDERHLRDFGAAGDARARG
jgi:hypothetical protein